LYWNEKYQEKVVNIYFLGHTEPLNKKNIPTAIINLLGYYTRALCFIVYVKSFFKVTPFLEGKALPRTKRLINPMLRLRTKNDSHLFVVGV